MPTDWLVSFIGTSKVFSVYKKGRVVMGKFQNFAYMLAKCKILVNLRIVLAAVFENDGIFCDFC